MKIFSYDICEDDKGIIFAETEEQAREIFEEEYPDIEVVDYYDDYHTCVITEVCNYNNEAGLVFLYD